MEVTVFRLISLPLHGALELVIGLAIAGSAFALGFGVAGTVAAMAIGALVVGLALAAATIEDGGGSVANHHASDWGVVTGLAAAAVLLAALGEETAGAAFAVAGVAMAVLALTTRYSVHH
jgi:hypothetical protein